MKKCILLIVGFCLFLLLSIDSNANVMPEWNDKMTSIIPVSEETSFNLISGCPEELFVNTDFYSYGDKILNEVKMKKGGFYWNGRIASTTDINIKADLYVEFKGENYAFLSALVKLDGDVIFNTETTLCDDPHNKICKEIDLNEYFHTNDLLFEYRCTSHMYELDDNEYENLDVNPQYDSYELGFGCLVGTIIKENTVYNNEDLYFITDVASPISKEDLINSIVVTDQTDGTISENIRIDKNEYILNEGKIAAGTYSMRLYASDSAGNISYQNAKVLVADTKAPVIEAEDIEREYCNQLKDLKSLFTVSDNSGEYTLEIIEDNYTANYNKLDKYTVTAKATDPSGHSSTKTVTITVIDKIPPAITTKEGHATSTSPITTEEGLNQFVRCWDYIDHLETTITYEDLDSYFENPTKIGTYHFNVIGYDKSGNKGYGSLKLIITDDDYPAIYAEKYTITVNKGETLSEDDIANLLLQAGQINSLGNLSMTSAYFDTPNVEGDYDLIVSSTEGVYTDVISVVSNSENKDKTEEDNKVIDTIDYSIPKVDEKKDYSTYYIIAIVVGILALISFGFVIYKRKH